MPSLLQAATAPASVAGVKNVVGRRFALFPQPERSDGEWAEWWADYIDVIGHLPEGAIEAAMAAWVRMADAEFMPKPGKLLELAKTTPNRDVRAYERCKAAIEYQPPRQAHPADDDLKYIDPKVRGLINPLSGRVEPTQADKERVRRQMREYIEQDEARKAMAKTASTAKRLDVSGPVDETGVTPSMRAYLNRRDFQEQDGDWS